MSQSLHVLLQHSEGQRDEALAALQKAEALLLQLTQQAEQLRVYRQEYQQRHPAIQGGATSIDMLRHHQGFMERLDQAMAQQQQQLQGAQTRGDARRAELLAAELRVASVRKLLERRAQAQAVMASRVDQRGTDDAAANASRRAHEHALQPTFHR
jgi:flagellar protein FliJ